MSDLSFCKCGCWERVSKRENKYINGHHWTGKKRGPMEESHIRKLSESHKISMNKPEVKLKVSIKTKEAMSNPKVKEKHRKAVKIAMNRLEVRKLQSKLSKEAWLKPEVIKKHVGERNGMWRGGISIEPYCDIFLNQEFKNMILRKDFYTCQNCGITRLLSLKVYGMNLVIHHINYIKKDCEVTNLLTLCVSCNIKANFNRELWESHYKKIMKERRQ